MKYLLLGYTPAADWDAATAGTVWGKVSGPGVVVFGNPNAQSTTATFSVFGSYELSLTASDGEFVSSEGLGHPVVSTTVRKTPDGVVATDGPFAELKEVLASFAVIDVASLERAVEIVSRIVETLGEPVEIRPIMGEDFTA